MAIFHFNLKPVQRSKGRSIVQVVSYITAVPLTDHRTGKRHRRASDDDEIRVGRIGPLLSREEVWNKAERAERRKDGVVGRHVVVALPVELQAEEQWALLWNMAIVIHEETGAPVEVSMHLKKKAHGKATNPHGHIVLGSRRWVEEAADFGAKTRQLDDRRTGGPIIEGWRECWENLVNHALPEGVQKVSRLSHARAGRKRVPRRHLGEHAWQQEQKGYQTRDGEFNRMLDELDSIQSERVAVEHTIRHLESGEAKTSRDIALERELARASVQIQESEAAHELKPRPPSHADEILVATVSAPEEPASKHVATLSGVSHDPESLLQPRLLSDELLEAEERVAKGVAAGVLVPER